MGLIIGQKVRTPDGHVGTLEAARPQLETNVRGKVITPPDKQVMLVVNLGEECTAATHCPESVEHGLTNYYPGQVTLLDGGEIVSATLDETKSVRLEKGA